jgi:mono/diheme cytochrome c family protein
MRRWLPVMLILVLALTLACGDDSDDDDDSGDTVPTPTLTTGTGTGGEATATTAEDEGDDEGDDEGEGDAAAGEAIAQAQCFSCHSIDGSTIVGPTWQGLYGHEVTLDDGSTVTADDEYLHESIVDPNAKIVEGFPAAMPELGLDDDQIADVIAYIKTLE